MSALMLVDKFALQQWSGDVWVLVQAGCRFISELGFVPRPLNLELLAVLWAILKCKIFLAGLSHFKIVTDHHPQISINITLMRLKILDFIGLGGIPVYSSYRVA